MFFGSSASVGHIIVTDPWTVIDIASHHVAALSHQTALVPRPQLRERKQSLSISCEHFATEYSQSGSTFRLLWP